MRTIRAVPNFTVLRPQTYAAFCTDLGSTEEQLIKRGETVETIQISTCFGFLGIYYSAIIKSIKT